MKNIEVQMLLYTLTKKFIEVQIIMLNAFSIILFYKMMQWFDAQDIGVEFLKLRFNPPYQHTWKERRKHPFNFFFLFIKNDFTFSIHH
jgi:hypothetical protein